MAKSEKLMPQIQKWEGGYANHPNDKGGCTMKGITIGTYREFFGDSKTCSDLKNITDEEWLNIFEEGYWNPMCANDIENQSVANIIVDWAWMSGVKNVSKKIQTLIGVEADGIFGKQTISKINSMDSKDIFDKIVKRREKFYHDICEKNPSQEVFLKGWLNRLNDYEYEEENQIDEYIIESPTKWTLKRGNK